MATIIVDERSTKEKIRDWKDRQVERAKNGLHWCAKNPQYGIPIVFLGVKSTMKLASGGIRAVTVDKEIRFRTHHMYDRSMGRYIELRRPLTDTEALLIEERRRNGEGLMAILSSMKLLKRR